MNGNMPWAAALLGFCLSLFSAAGSAAAEDKVTFDFEDEADVAAWSNLALTPPEKQSSPAYGDKDHPVKIELSTENVTSGKHSLKLTFSGGGFPAVTTVPREDDWSAFKTFRADVTVSRQCMVIFRVLEEKSSREPGYAECHTRWVKAARCEPGKNEVVEQAPAWQKVVAFEIGMSHPRDGESIYVDNIRLSTTPTKVNTPFRVAYVYSPGPGYISFSGPFQAAYFPKLDRKIPVLGMDLEVANLDELVAKLKETWTKPEDRSIQEVETQVRAEVAELKKTHPRAVLAVLRDGEKGFDPADPDRVYAGWKDAGISAHPGPALNLCCNRNGGRAETVGYGLRLRPGMIQVDLSGISAGAEVLSAKLVLVRAGALSKDWNEKPAFLVAEPCNRDWDELAVDSYEYAKDHFWKDTWGMSWEQDDPDFFPVWIAHGVIGGSTTVLDFTHAVKWWTDGRHVNHGCTLYGVGGFTAFSREVKEVRNRPALFVVYEPKE